MKKIIFLSGTRADWGKIKALVQKVKESPKLDYKVFVCGMHLLELYGKTFIEIYKDGFDQVFLAKAHKPQEKMELTFAEILKEFSHFLQEERPDLIVVHGDRLEALAGAIAGALNHILVAHIEGGEVSGTIDESIRHSISKFAHLHFVCNAEARNRLLQLGEAQESIFIIGSPDIDLMLSANLPSLETVQEHYFQIAPFKKEYAILLYHPVTTEIDKLQEHISQVVKALKRSSLNFIVIYPNNDLGSDLILQAYQSLRGDPHFALFKSVKFEAFLTLLKHAKFIIGNSSAGIREAPIYAIPCIDLGSRQQGRGWGEGIIHAQEEQEDILAAITKALTLKLKPTLHFGEGKSAQTFIELLEDQAIWNQKLQKKFVDIR